MPSSELQPKASAPPAKPRRLRLPRTWRGRAYTVVALAVGVTLMNIAVAAALPAWSHMIQHDKEEELIFRGLQIAEAIRVQISWPVNAASRSNASNSSNPSASAASL